MYSYKALAEDISDIRILKIYPGQYDDQLRASLQHVSLLSLPPKYETISYYWGSLDLREMILVDGIPTFIPTNAAAVVRQVRRTWSSRVVWIDALCINQLDLGERAAQVALMGEIYSQSTGNLIYLGAQTADVDYALHGISQLVQEAKARTNGFKDFASLLLDADGYHHRNSPQPSAVVESIRFKQVFDFFDRPWFRRVWVVQEVALAPQNTVLCERHEVPLSQLLIAAAWLSYVSPWLPGNMQDLPGICHTPFMLSRLANVPEFPTQTPKIFSQDDMANLLAFQHGLEASDPRDRVFALLALTRYSSYSAVPDSLKPDYTKTAIQVLRDATRLAMSETLPGKPSGLSVILRRITHDSDADLTERSWPTWLPKWDRPLRISKHGRRLHIGFDSSRGMDGPGTGLLKTASADVLELRGVRLQQIVKVGPILEQEAEGRQNHRLWFQKTMAILKGTTWDSPVGTLHAERQAVLALTLTCGVNAERDIAQAQTLLCEFMDFAFAETEVLDVQIVEQGHSWVPGDANRFRKAFLNGAVNRHLFLTADERIGMGPALTSPDDIVVVLYGANTPYVLRPCGEHFQVLGQCYMHGAMFGETVEHRMGQATPNEVFVIR